MMIKTLCEIDRSAREGQRKDMFRPVRLRIDTIIVVIKPTISIAIKLIDLIDLYARVYNI
jgi:hypothetical protein